jgi:Mrp family chromosome partitioning ATPase
MFAIRRSKSQIPQYDTSLVLQSANGAARVAFSPETVRGFRRMVTGLQYRGTFPSRVAITSALQGEGVTFTTLALATTLASDVDTRVCAVELNWHTPGMLAFLTGANNALQRRWFGRIAVRKPTVPPAPDFSQHSLAAVLAGTTSLDEALLETSLPNLKLLPAGDLPLNQRPSIARSEALANCIEQLSQQFDHLLLDVPAVMLTSDAVALASLSQNCCFVVRQGVTAPMLAQRALDEIKHLTVLGVVLNRVQLHTPGWIQKLIPQE